MAETSNVYILQFEEKSGKFKSLFWIWLKKPNFKVSKQKNSESQFIHSTAKNLFKEWLGHNVKKPFHFFDVIQIYLDIRLIHVYQVMDF